MTKKITTDDFEDLYLELGNLINKRIGKMDTKELREQAIKTIGVLVFDHMVARHQFKLPE